MKHAAENVHGDRGNGALKESAVSAAFSVKPHESDELSKNARRLLKHAANRVGYYVEQMLVRRHTIANALSGGKAEVNLTKYANAEKAVSALKKVPLQVMASGAQLAGTFIQLLKDQESKHQLWLALFTSR